MRTASYLLLTTVYLLLSATLGTAQEWGFVTNGEANPKNMVASADGMTIVAAYHNAGFWRTVDGGANWEPINSQITDAVFIQADNVFRMDSDADTLLVTGVTLDDYEPEYHSFDGGESWTSFDFDTFWPDELPSPSGGFWAAPPDLDGTLYIATQTVFGRGQQFGTWWEGVNINDMTLGLEGMVVNPYNSQNVFLYSSWEDEDRGPVGGILMTFDGGETWDRVPLEDILPTERGSVRSLVVMPNGDLIAATHWYVDDDYPVFIRSSDDGATWEMFPYSGLPDGHRGGCLLAVPEVPGRLLSTTSLPGIYLSDDSGESWTRVETVPVDRNYAEDFYRNPDSGDIYLTVSERGIYRSTDYGLTWEHIPGPPVGPASRVKPDVDGIWQNTYHADVWFARGQSATFSNLTPTFEDGYQTWNHPFAMPEGTLGLVQTKEEHTSGTRTVSIATIDPETYDFTWSDENEYDFHIVQHVEGSDPLQLIGYGHYYDRYFLSDDLGNTWSEVAIADMYLGQILQHRGGFYSVDQLNNDVVRTDDLLEPWESTSLPTNNGFLSLPMLTVGDTLYVWNTQQYYAYLPDDTWEHRLNWQNHIVQGWDVVTTDTDTFFVAIDYLWEPKLVVSDDFCASWQDADLQYPYPPQTPRLYHVRWDNFRQLLWVDTAAGLAYLDFADLSVDDPWVLQPAEFELLNAYPNPFNAQTTVTYSLANAQDVRLEVYDLLGRRVTTLVDGMRQPGQHETVFDAAGLASGTYYMRLNAGHQQDSRKLILLR